MSQQNKSQNRIYHEVKNTGFEFSFNKDFVFLFHPQFFHIGELLNSLPGGCFSHSPKLSILRQ